MNFLLSVALSLTIFLCIKTKIFVKQVLQFGETYNIMIKKRYQEDIMNRLQDKVAVITGANSGVGEATALAFAKEGATVVISARRVEPLNAVADKIRSFNGKVLAVPTDISDRKACDNLINEAIKAFGKIDILVNNAGVLESGLKPIDRFADEDLDRLVNTNEKGTMYCMRAALGVMQEWASIVNVASVAGVMGCGGAAYVASKAAIVGITKHTAMRYADKHIRCNAVCPGNIITPMTSNIKDLDRDMITAMSKHGDLTVGSCTAEQVAGIILFLASDEAKPINGQILVTDFGSTL